MEKYLLPALALVCFLFSGCLSDTPVPAPTAVPATATPGGILPAFSDWRLAYLLPNGKLGITTLDGKTTLTGPGLSPGGASLWREAVIAPDGRAFAYQSSVVNLWPGAPGYEGMQHLDNAVDFSWSPDSTRLIFLAGSGSTLQWEMLTRNSSTPVPVPFVEESDSVIGWMDNTHLAITHGAQVANFDLVALDITTGARRKITTILNPDDSLSLVFFSLAPDGSEILLSNSAGEGSVSYNPLVEVINTTSGQKRLLPHILKAAGYGLASVIWKPGTELVLETSGDPSAPSLLLDLARDTATPFASGVVPLGWAPDTGALYVGSEINAPDASVHRYQIGTMAAPPPATAMQPLFPIDGVSIPFIGFVRNA